MAFATIQVGEGRYARLEFGRDLDPALTDEELLRRHVLDRERRGDELRDLPTSDAWPILVQLLGEFREHPSALAATIRSLGELVWDEPGPSIEPFLEHGSREVRAAAVEALGRMGYARAAPAVLRLLPSDDPAIRRAAHEAAGKFGLPVMPEVAALLAGDDPVLAPLARLSAERTRAFLTADFEQVVSALIESQQWRDLHGWLGFIRRVLLDGSRSPRHSDLARARMRAILLVRQVRKVGPEALGDLADDAIDDATKHELIVGMGRSRIAHAIPGILPYLTHAEERMQHAAVVALGRIGHPYALLPVAGRWDAFEGRLREWSLVAMRRMSAVDGAAAFEEALQAGADPAPGHAVFVGDGGELSDQLPRAWLAAQLAGPAALARRDAALALGLFGGPADAATLQAAQAREPDPDLGFLMQLAIDRLTRPGLVETRFRPWPAPSA